MKFKGAIWVEASEPTTDTYLLNSVPTDLKGGLGVYTTGESVAEGRSI
jgi:hypothetical protein